MSRKRWIILLAAIVAILSLGVIVRELRQSDGTTLLASEPVVPLVTVVTPSVHEGRITVSGTGTVRPRREVTLVAQVAGKITWVADEFVAGGVFREGDEILRIDSTDYANAVTVAQAEVTQRQLDLLRAEEEMTIAKEEWSVLERRSGVKQEMDSTVLGRLVFKEPQWRAAAAQLRSAKARLHNADVQLSRTRIVAPYNGRVRSKGADLDQYVTPGHALASFFGTDAVEVDVPIAGNEMDLLGDLLKPGGPASRARIVARNAAGANEWSGVVHRTEGVLSETTRMLNAVVRVQAPYEQRDDRPPLFVGTFVTAYIAGREFDRYYTLPREALRQGNLVWVVRNLRLYEQSVEIIHEMEDTLFLSGGITGADSVVVSMLEVVVDGMRVRAVDSGASTLRP